MKYKCFDVHQYMQEHHFEQQTQCNHCYASITYSYEDIFIIEGSYRQFVYCPCCGKEVKATFWLPGEWERYYRNGDEDGRIHHDQREVVWKQLYSESNTIIPVVIPQPEPEPESKKVWWKFW